MTGKTTTSRRIAVRETGVCWHHGAPLCIENPLYVEHYSTIILRDFKGTLNWASIMSSGMSLSDSRGKQLSIHEFRAFARCFCLWEASAEIARYQFIHEFSIIFCSKSVHLNHDYRDLVLNEYFANYWKLYRKVDLHHL